MLQRVVAPQFNTIIRNIVYVPKHKPPDHQDFEKLREFLLKHEKILVVTGAGISTESGNPSSVINNLI